MSEKEKILDIAMNLNRVGNWAADDYSAKRKRISTFLDQTSDYLDSVDLTYLPPKVKKPLQSLIVKFSSLKEEGENGPKDRLDWAEKMMTWGNILTHRANLISQ
ncbi:MAG: hypothetical protein Q8O75_03640 [bacterium]|nr:hypothetical protein [bacterium]